MTKITPSTDRIVESEVKEAYWDCWGGKNHREPKNYGKRRNLNFKATYPVSRAKAIMVMKKYCPEYNNFTPNYLAYLPTDSDIYLAREGSVCVYVHTRENLATDAYKKLLRADEISYEGNYYRIWWD